MCCIGGSLKLPMWFTDDFVVTFLEGGGELSAYMLAYKEKYPSGTRLIDVWRYYAYPNKPPTWTFLEILFTFSYLISVIQSLSWA